jgi:vitamin-K-epoxide reductase (warfarin-sensitive)
MVLRPGWQVSLIQLLAVPGLLLSFFLYLFHEDLLVAACVPGGWDDCGAVSGPGAPYASVGPIPVAAIGFAGYAAIFLVAWLRDWSDTIAAYLPELLVGLTGIAVLFTTYLTALEIFVIHAVCRYCLVSAAIILVMLILSISYLRRPGDTEEVTSTAEVPVT